jgi:phosphatidate cytidylyltransferase
MSDEQMPRAGGEAPRSLISRLGDDFPRRLVWGLGMGLVAAFVIFSGATPFAVLVLLVALLLGWEWSRLVHGSDAYTLIAVHVGAAGVAAVLAALGYVGLALIFLPIGAILAMLLSLGRNSLFSALGVFYAGMPAIAMIWLRSDVPLGLSAVVFLVVIVIVSDTAGFLAGRLLEGPRLWSRVSPRKTWAGFIAALGVSAIVGALFWLIIPGSSPVRLAASAAILAFFAQIGDLAESALKRRFGVKDASSLIPGHGGVMDRVDGLVAAASVVALASLVINVHSPAHALLFGF